MNTKIYTWKTPLSQRGKNHGTCSECFHYNDNNGYNILSQVYEVTLEAQLNRNTAIHYSFGTGPDNLDRTIPSVLDRITWRTPLVAAAIAGRTPNAVNPDGYSPTKLSH